MKNSTVIVTRAGKFKILFAVKGPRSADPSDVKKALRVAVNRVARAERRFTLLRERRASQKRKLTRRATRKPAKRGARRGARQ